MPRATFSSQKRKGRETLLKSQKRFPDIAKKVIEESDIILEVLDARFPEETRNISIEELIKKRNKILIYVLNKSDLVKSQRKFSLSPSIYVSSKKRKSGRVLRNLIKRNARKMSKEEVIVGVIGYPNTGKSCLINLLIGRSSARFSAEAGFTKGVQKLRLSSGILLLDSPGVIPKEEYSTTNRADKKHAEIGVKTYDKIKDPELAISELIKKYPQILEEFYKIKSDKDSEIFLERLGEKKRFLKKKGEIDIDRTARLVLRDWQSGKIKI